MDTTVGEQRDQQGSAEEHMEEGKSSTCMEAQFHERLAWPSVLVKHGLEAELDAAAKAQGWVDYCEARGNGLLAILVSSVNLVLLALGLLIVGRLCLGISIMVPTLIACILVVGVSFVVIVKKLLSRDRTAVQRLAESVRPVVKKRGWNVTAEGYTLVFDAPPFSFDRTLVKVMTYTDEQGDGSQLQCAICLNDCSCGEAMALLPCDHRFHLDCAKQWLSREFTCPSCRHDIMCEGLAVVTTSAATTTTDDDMAHTSILVESASHLARPVQDEQDTASEVSTVAMSEEAVHSPTRKARPEAGQDVPGHVVTIDEAVV